MEGTYAEAEAQCEDPVGKRIFAVLAREGGREGGAGAPDTLLADLPLHAWRDGVASGTVCGPVPMTDGAARRLLDAGLIPVAWTRGRDAVRLLSTRSAGGSSLL